MKYYLTEAEFDATKITPEDWRRLFSRGDTRVPQTRNPIRKPASTAKPKPKPVQKEFKFEEKKKTLLQRVSAWVQPSGSRVKVPKEMTTDQRERAYKRFKRTALGESSRGVNRIVRRVKAGHLDPNAPTVKQKEKDQLERYKETEAGGDPDDRMKNVRGTLASVARGMEDRLRLPNVLRTRHELDKSPDAAGEAKRAADTRPPHVVRAVRRAHSRSIGTYVPGRDQTGTVTALAQQRKEEPTVDKDIADKAKAYRRIRRRSVPPSMN